MGPQQLKEPIPKSPEQTQQTQEKMNITAHIITGAICLTLGFIVGGGLVLYILVSPRCKYCQKILRNDGMYDMDEICIKCRKNLFNHEP